jgi:Dienelactone hydrolase and related enzymes
VDQKIISLVRPLHPWRHEPARISRPPGRTGGLDRRAVALLPLLQNDYAQAAIIAPDDGRLLTERVSYESPKGRINGYLVRAKAMGKRPAVIVIHENRGLNPHIEDIARRLAVEGYLALAPDLCP